MTPTTCGARCNAGLLIEGNLLMSHQRQMECPEKPTPQEWRGYQRLGAAVIASAVKDLKKPTRVGGKSLRLKPLPRRLL